MQTNPLPNLSVIFATIEDPRMTGCCTHDFVEMGVAAVCASLCGADSFVEITQWAEAKLDWLKQFLKLDYGIIASHDTYGRRFALLNPHEFEACVQ